MAAPQRAMEFTVDGLARVAQLPVRTIREYQTLRLLPPPTRRGRVGIYGAEHLERLGLITRLQRRGYSLAGVRDLLEAWDAGTGLPGLLGVEVGPMAMDETPLRLTTTQLKARLPGLNTKLLRRAENVGLVVRQGRHFLVRSPALVALATDAVGSGAELGDVLDLIGVMRDSLGELAQLIAGHFVDRIWDPAAKAGEPADVDALLRRGRLLLLQGVASMLADRLGEALLRRADDATDGEALRAAVERVRVGAIADATGNIDRRKRT